MQPANTLSLHSFWHGYFDSFPAPVPESTGGTTWQSVAMYHVNVSGYFLFDSSYGMTLFYV